MGASVPSKSKPMTASADTRTRAAYFCSPSTEPNSMPITQSDQRDHPKSALLTVVRQYRRRMARRLALVLTCAILACSAVTGLTWTAAALVGEVPTVGTPAIAATSAATVSVSVPVDSHGSDTTVMVEYVTAGAYRDGAAKVPSAATTVTIGTTPASDAGPALITALVSGLDPGSTYRMRVKALNANGEGTSADVTVPTPEAPKVDFKAKVGKDTTRLTKLTVSRLVGGESATVTCKSATKGCPFTSQTVTALATGKQSLTRLLKRAALDPGAKVVVKVADADQTLSTLTLRIRDGQQPKVKRG